MRPDDARNAGLKAGGPAGLETGAPVGAPVGAPGGAPDGAPDGTRTYVILRGAMTNRQENETALSCIAGSCLWLV